MSTVISTKTSGVGGLTVTGDASGVLELASANGTTAVTIDASQNVGIGTSSPAYKLEANITVAATTGVQDVAMLRAFSSGSTDGTFGARLLLGTENPNGNSWPAGIASINDVGGSNLSALGFYTATSGPTLNERARIDASGNLLVGTTSSLSGVGSEFRGSVSQGGSGVLAAYNTLTSAADASPPLVVNKGMTTTTSSARFVQFYASAGAVPMGGIVGNGASNVQFAALSDSREKTNIQEISGSLTKVIALKPVEFDWIADNSHVNAGFIAQDVKEIFPDFVVDNMANDGQEQRYGLTGGMTGGIIPHLVKAIQEQQTLIEALTARLTALEAK